jgi:PAS domain-containing protein
MDEGHAGEFLGAVHPDDRALVRATKDAAVATPAAGYRCEYRVLSPAGGTRWVESRGRVIAGPGGAGRRIVGISFDVTERHALEQSLRASEEQRRLALDAAGLGLWDLDYVTGTGSFDGRFRELFGLGPDEPVTPEAVWSRIDPADVPRVRATVEAAKDPASGGAYEAEYRVVLPDGTRRWHLSRAQVHFEGVGDARRARRMVGVVMDTTERRRAEEDLKAGEQRLRLALGAGRMGVWSWDLATGRQDWDDTTCRLFGLAPGTELTRERFLALVHPDDRAGLEAVTAAAVEGEQHVVGLTMAASLLLAAGYDVRPLGADVPVGDAVEQLVDALQSP